MIEIALTVRFDIPDLDHYGPKGSPSTANVEFPAKLILESNKNPFIELRTFHNASDYLDMKVLNAPSVNLGTQVGEQVTFSKPENSYGDIVAVDFTDARIAGMQRGGKNHEGGRKYFSIWFDSAKVQYDQFTDQPTNSLNANFYLTDSAISLIDRQYAMVVGMDDKSVVKVNNKRAQNTSFGQVEFVLDFVFSRDQREDGTAIHIQKEPRLALRHNSLAEHEVVAHASTICSLLSFYINREIDYSWAHIYNHNNRITLASVRQHPYKPDPIGVFFGDLPAYFDELASKVKSEFLVTNHKLFAALVQRYNTALQAGGTTRFMLFYNVLEQLRNLFVETKKETVREKFIFVESRSKTDKTIREALKGLLEIVAEDDKEEFAQAIPGKASFIKLRTMDRQFDSMMEHCGFSAADFGLEFNEMKKLRNAIFHGGLIAENNELLVQINDRLPRFVGAVFWFWIGIAIGRPKGP